MSNPVTHVFFNLKKKGKKRVLQNLFSNFFVGLLLICLYLNKFFQFLTLQKKIKKNIKK